MANKKDYDKAIDEMAIVSNALFSTAFDGRPDRAVFLLKDVLEYLKFKDFKIISSKTQVRQSHLLQHDTIVDVKVQLESGEQIITEIELSHPERFIPRRGRYIHSSNDVAAFKEGMKYSEIPTQILIVISKKDLNNTGLPIAVVKSRFDETGQIYEDGRITVFITYDNMTGKNEPIERYIHDLFETDYEKVSSPIAREILEEVKVNKEGRMQFEGYLQKMIDEEVADYQKEIDGLKKDNLELKEANKKEIDGLKKDNLELKEANRKLEDQLASLKAQLEQLSGNLA